MSRRIHITGASGSGTTTLGRALANELAIPHFDTDDFFWQPTIRPYQEARSRADRLRLIQELFAPRPEWILSGSLCGWGDPLLTQFDLIIFLTTPRELHLRRLKEREVIRYGHAELEPGGLRYEDHKIFMDWAANYDQPDFAGRSLEQQQAWLKAAPCKVVKLSSDQPVREQIAAVLRA